MEESGVAASGWEFCGVVRGFGSSSADPVAMGGFRLKAATELTKPIDCKQSSGGVAVPMNSRQSKPH